MLHGVVDEASQCNIILLVLDARDPAGCHGRLVERKRRYAGAKRRA
jgi:hypothetical protein